MPMRPHGERRTAANRNRTMIAMLLAMLLTWSVAPSESLAWLNGSPYAGHSSSCSSDAWSDPVTIFWYGSAGALRYLAATGRGGFYANAGEIQYFTKPPWQHQIKEGGQYHYENSQCVYVQDQLASAFGYPNSRYHIRLWQPNLGAEASGIYGTVGTPHHEHWNWGCKPGPWGFSEGSHVVDGTGSQGSGFDRARRLLATAFERGHHHLQPHKWDNTKSFLQCDGETYAGGNGYVDYITAGHTH
jgi:hypothetical protein